MTCLRQLAEQGQGKDLEMSNLSVYNNHQVLMKNANCQDLSPGVPGGRARNLLVQQEPIVSDSDRQRLYSDRQPYPKVKLCDSEKQLYCGPQKDVMGAIYISLFAYLYLLLFIYLTLYKIYIYINLTFKYILSFARYVQI